MAIKYIDIAEFCDKGFLQEANRQFFHPLGLALEVTVEDDGTMRLSGVWDYRDDDEGMLFAQGVIRQDKYESVLSERDRHKNKRNKIFMGKGDVQPVHDEAVDWEAI